jgi:hypothetical protein
MTVLVIAAVGVTPAGAFQGPFSGTVQQNSDGTFTIDPRDQNDALKSGYIPVRRDTRAYNSIVSAPAAAAVGAIVASVALTNTTLTIASSGNVPDTMRKCQVRVDPGTSAITAGVCTVTYAANDGTAAQVDALSLVTAASTLLTVPFTKGVLSVTKAVTSGVVGGTSPKIQIDTTAALAVPIPPNAVDVTLLKEETDGADNTTTPGTITNAGIWTPNTAPNATHTFGIVYSTIAP